MFVAVWIGSGATDVKPQRVELGDRVLERLDQAMGRDHGQRYRALAIGVDDVEAVGGAVAFGRRGLAFRFSFHLFL